MRIYSFLRTIVVTLSLLANGTQLQAFVSDSTQKQTGTFMDPSLARLDSMAYELFTRDKFFVPSTELQASINMPYELIPQYTPEQIKAKMKAMNTEVPMTYNSNVKQFIDFFAYKRRALMARCLANGQIYFPLFEETLDRKGLPIELKYLPVIESAFNPVAVSGAGATGLWQLMYGTGTYLGLDINTYVDERRDPAKSTEAAVEYLKKLYDMYGDWHLVLAAYNSGPGNVNKAIARAGGVKNYWAIYNYLPAETRGYVPIYLAAVYVLSHAKDYKLESEEPKRELYALDTVVFTAKVSLKHVSEILGISQDELQFLNPSLKKAIVPYCEKGYCLNLPVNYITAFEVNKKDIMNDTSLMAQYTEVLLAAAPKATYHKVKKGQSITQIAGIYGVSSSSIKSWNRLKSSYVYPGQTLVIYTRPKMTETAPTYAQAFTSKPIKQGDSTGVKTGVTSNTVAAADTAANKGNTLAAGNDKCNCVYHVVQAGDTLWNIAQKYEGLTVDKLKADNQSIKDRPLKIGDVLKIIAN